LIVGINHKFIARHFLNFGWPEQREDGQGKGKWVASIEMTPQVNALVFLVRQTVNFCQHIPHFLTVQNR